MQEIAEWALSTAALRGASYADTRIGDERSRALATKNGKIASASDAESQGIGVRVIAEGAWGFAASDNLSREAVEATAAKAVAIAKASARVKQHDIQLAPEKPATADWTSPFKIDPFATSVEQNLDLLLKIDSELRSEVDPQLVGRFPRLRKIEDLDDAADADVDPLELGVRKACSAVTHCVET